MPAEQIREMHRVQIMVQLRGRGIAVNQFEVRAHDDNGETYTGSGSMGDNVRLLQQVLDELRQSYPARTHVRLGTSGKRLVPNP